MELRPGDGLAFAVTGFETQSALPSSAPGAAALLTIHPFNKNTGGLARRNGSSQLSVALSARFAVTSILSVCSIPRSLALTVEPRSVSHCDVHVLVARPPLHGADIHTITQLVRYKRVTEAMQLTCGTPGLVGGPLDFVEQMPVHITVFVREESAASIPFGGCPLGKASNSLRSESLIGIFRVPAFVFGFHKFPSEMQSLQ